jgi:hypothetical protein
MRYLLCLHTLDLNNISFGLSYPSDSAMETLNGIHIIDCESLGTEPLNEIQCTDKFKTFAQRFGSGLKRNGIVYLVNTSVDEATVN